MGSIVAFICIHMLLWAGCDSTWSPRKLGSDENLLRKALDFNQPSKGLWRKLLEEDPAKPSDELINEEATKVSVTTESKSVQETNATQNEEKAHVEDVKKENVDVHPKTEVPKTGLDDPKEGKSESAVALITQNDANTTKEPNIAMIQEASKEEEGSSKKTEGNAVEKSKEIKDTHTIEAETTEKTEDSTSQALVPPQDAQIKEMPTSGTNEDGVQVLEEKKENAPQTPVQTFQEADSSVKTEEKPVDIAVEETPSVKADVEESKDASSVDTKEKDALHFEGQDKVPDDVKEKISAVAAVDDEKRDEQKEEAPGETKTPEGEQQDKPAEGGSASESIEKKEEIAEDNPIKMVETASDVIHTELTTDSDGKIAMVQSSEAEGDDKGLSVEMNNPNGTDDSSGENSNTNDVKVDKVDTEKIEEKQDVTTEIIDQKDNDNGTQEASSQVTSDAKVEDEHASSDDATELKNKESEDSGTEEPQVKSEEKAEETHESSDDNTELKEKESEEKEVLLVKSDDETEAATQEVESQLEALKRDAVFETPPDEQRQERDPADDEYDIIQELVDLPTKFQETAGKVADHLRPDVLKWTDTSKVYFNFANQQITESFSPLIGKQYAPFFASMISYCILLLPLIVVIVLFEHIKALFSLQKVLLFINIYLAAYFATLWLASFIIGLEPMSFFYLNSLSSYLSLQLLQALGYVVYLILQTANIINSCTSDTLVGKITSLLQWVVAMAIGLHYYVTVFHPAVASKPPHTSWKFYAIYSAAFFILCLFARIKWVKKQYVIAGSGISNKKS